MKRYIPLLVMLTLTALAAAAMQFSSSSKATGTAWMLDFMGLFLVIFAMLKLFDLHGFAKGFQMYDLLAKQTPLYALIYPFLELCLGLAYLARFQLQEILVATIVLMLFGSLGVINALRQGLNVNCACMGNTLKVPLSTVALVEDLGMVAMAASMLFLG